MRAHAARALARHTLRTKSAADSPGTAVSLTSGPRGACSRSRSSSNSIPICRSSPRRRELLRQIGIEFALLLLRAQAPRGPDVSETAVPGESAADFVRRVCRAKARAAWARIKERSIRSYPVLAADT